ncbi:helix-turn-helix domain-containing protein [Gordonia paraffinivorans]|uniref:helix-turn-helix domain-containing protein n=1 Tax=Gordonia paraffinivorans TaxID=175628 RepID=UPI001FF765B2|nr:helix-turn-helix domain-containing protein [Gordonia paraffinivorans]
MANKTAIPSGYEMLSIRDLVSEYKYARHTWYEWIAEGKLPAYRLTDKPGARIRVRRADVEALLLPVIPTEVYAHRT